MEGIPPKPTTTTSIQCIGISSHVTLAEEHNVEMNVIPRVWPAVYGVCRQAALMYGGDEPVKDNFKCWRQCNVGLFC